ncbi:uncharacterized protein LOC113500798 [Trichoplusia ni]|uniref:Uncharacterized protein LOC113500798 n=1 Tax=Trichoplusia ni TaxID=7111 RepID=A0A7E5WA23_TRINI|nr:uncharacterized protein LOC113500798 [Trichoplusia ni]
MLPGSLPWDLDAKTLAAAYEWRKDLLERDERPPPRVVGAMLKELRNAFLEVWAERLTSPGAGSRTVGAVRRVLQEWVCRRHGEHGCFSNYLIARKESTRCCHHCDDSEDNAQHTLEVCSAWAIQRQYRIQKLVAVLGGDLSLPSVIASMVGFQRKCGKGAGAVGHSPDSCPMHKGLEEG